MMVDGMALDRSGKSSFDEVASLYDEVRPGYPERLIEDTITLSGIPDGGQILEVGCGPGKATIPFARRGYQMLCLELGGQLARLAAQNLAAYSRVTVANVAFEAWPLQPAAFNLVLSAEAWHWIAPDVGYRRAATALRPGGALALCWHQQPLPDTPFYRALVDLYAEKAPEPLLVAHPDPDGLITETVTAIDTSGFFGEVDVRTYWWTATYSSGQYLKLLNTYSMYRALEADVRERLLVAVAKLVAEFGGVVERPYRTVLYVARRGSAAG